MKVTLPFPPKELNPNKRNDRRAIGGIRARYRDECYYLSRQQTAAAKWVPLITEVALSVTFVQPDKRLRDVDNMLASAKSALDGFALALGMNDRQFKPIKIDWTRGESPGAVIVEVHPLDVIAAMDRQLGIEP